MEGLIKSNQSGQLSEQKLAEEFLKIDRKKLSRKRGEKLCTSQSRPDGKMHPVQVIYT